MALKTKKIFFNSSIILGSLVVLGVAVFVLRTIEQAKADSFLPPDLNQDGIVDTKDIDLIKQNYANTVGGILNPSPYDLNNDRKINSLDLAIVEDNQGNGTNPERDWDKDGYSVTENDCNDRNNDLNPMAEEKADQIDNNCNGKVDEWVNYEPLSSRDVYLVNIHFQGSSSNPTLTVTSVSQKSLDGVYANALTYGEYAAVISNAQDETMDIVPFASCLNFEVLTAIGGETKSRPDCDQVIFVPKTVEVASITIKSLKDSSVSIPVPLNGSLSTFINEAYAETDASRCPSAIQKYVMVCLNVELADTLTLQKVIHAFETIDTKMPFLTMVPNRTLTFDSLAACGYTDAYMCQTSTGNLEINLSEAVFITDQNAFSVVLAHELAHYLEFTFASFGDISPSGDYADLYKQQISKMYRYINEKNCDFDAKKCILKPEELVAEWRGYVWRLPAQPLREVDGFEIWQDEINPATGKYDPMGPRPGAGFGVTRLYGLTNEIERWSTIFEGLFADTLDKDTLPLPDDQFPPETRPSYMSSTVSLINGTPRYGDFSEITRALKIFGKYGLIKDWDHDGVPDDYDNCSPKKYPGKCPIPSDPNATNACSNSDQGDYNNNKIGDKCEFPGENMWTACLPGGGLCSSPDGQRFAYNSPNTPRWPINGINPVLDYCSTAEPVYIGGSDHELTPQEICPSPDQK